MKKLLSLTALLFAAVLAFSGVAFGWGSSGGDGSNYRALQETAVFYNHSGATLTTGQAVILDASSDDITTGSTLGAYVTTTVIADYVPVVGVVAEGSFIDESPVVVITKGPAYARAADGTDNLTGYIGVGTTAIGTSKGYVGGGTHLGYCLENGDGTDGHLQMIWVQPTGGAD